MQQGGKRLTGTGDLYPKVSIVCVTFNAGNTLDRLLKSVAKYKTADIEFIIMDGNSTDGTADIIKAHEDAVDFWLSEPDNGVYDAMSYARGEWLIFLGADDELVAGFPFMMEKLKSHNTIYYGNVIFYGREFGKAYNDYYLTRLNLCHQAIFYPRAVFERYHYETKYRVYADYHLNLRLWKDKAFKFVHCNFLVARFAGDGFSMHTKDFVFEAERDKLFKRYLKPASYYRYLSRTIGAVGAFKRLVTGQ
jgi:glycosyltransferase involved in cell wall biosynthesis